MSEEIEIRTGPVRTSGYALKLRRAVNAALRDFYKKGELDPKKVNETITELNRIAYEVIVDKFQVPKEAVVNILVKIGREGDTVKIKDVNIEVWDKDEILSNNITKEVKNKLFPQ